MRRIFMYGRPCDIIIWAFKDNTPGRRFYERSGGKLTKEKVKMIGSQGIEEVAYSYRILN